MFSLGSYYLQYTEPVHCAVRIKKSELTSRSAPILFFQLLGLDVVVKNPFTKPSVEGIFAIVIDVCVVVD